MTEHKQEHPHDGGLVGGGAGTPTQGQSGETADLASCKVDDTDLDALDVEERQDVLVDEAVEETFPASDPISPKRIT